MYFVYILRCVDGTLYTGITTNVSRRFTEHLAGKGAHYTKVHKPESIVYVEEHENRSSALRREAEIKKWKREEKMLLVSREAPVV